MNGSDLFINALRSPGKEFGEVPFYWWTGDKLDKNRLTEQLEALAAKGVAGVQINYAHMLRGGEFDEPYGGHGKSIPGDPVQFTEEWWEMFRHAAEECERLGMGIGVGDYTLAWLGNGFFTDKVAADPMMNPTVMSCEKKMVFSGDEESFGKDVLAVVTYKDLTCREPILLYDAVGHASVPIPGCCEAYIIRLTKIPGAIDPSAPGCGEKLVNLYFEEFERRCPKLKKGTLNYFFQDELMFGCDEKLIWRESFRIRAEEKYGYDILGFLPHIFFDLGDLTPKIRMDLSEIRTSLFEEYYFKPIYNFHASRGMTYGCDQSSRGKDPTEFSDYFRTVRWFTAPGNDTPGRAADLIKVKVNSSIAHLYQRPRVWLEGYHSSGWGTTLESITAPTSDNFIFGANLLNLHGLYYSTKGGFFEWAPPDFHFRMPYWDDEETWLMKYRRLSALLTAGTHRCDAAIYYPVSSSEYGNNAEECVRTTFETASSLFADGIDFDFIDFQSIENAACENGRLKVAGEEYRLLLFAGVDCIRYSVVPKLKEFLDCGGAVAFFGMTPFASDRAGANDPVLLEDIRELLSRPNCRLIASRDDLMGFIDSSITRSFLPEAVEDGQKTYVCQRVLGDTKLFFVRYAPKDSVCRFEATGTPYLLDPYTGEIARLEDTVSVSDFTFIKMPNEAEEDTLILFTDDPVDYDTARSTAGFEETELLIHHDLSEAWDFRLLPTLDNKYGDYYLPEGGIIGAQARFFRITGLSRTGEELKTYDDLPYCTDLSFKRIPAPGRVKALARFLAEAPENAERESFSFGEEDYIIETPELHSRYGYICREENRQTETHEQGYHGLKGRVYDDQMYFDADSVFVTDVYSEKIRKVFIRSEGIAPDILFINGKEIEEPAGQVNLKDGRNRVIIGFVYDREKATDFRNRGEIKRAGLYFTTVETPAETGIPLAKHDFANRDYLRTLTPAGNADTFRVSFTAPPAFRSFTVNLFGKLLKATHDGQPMTMIPAGKGHFGGNKYTVITRADKETTSEVSFVFRPSAGYEYTAAIPEPIDIETGDFGKADCGNWAEMGVLAAYSGKARYSRKVLLSKINTDERFILDLGKVSATAKVEINGKTAAVFTYAPFRKDITDLVINGENEITVTVSNTLCNHYSTVPSRYSNYPRDAASGLIGPVCIDVIRKE